MSVNVEAVEEEEGAPEVCLVIHIIQGIDLLPASGDVSDPFVLIHWGSHELQTDQKPKTVHPSWDATFEVPVKLEEKTESIRFWIYSGGTVADSLLGKIDVDIDIEAAKQGMFSLPVTWLDVEPIELDARDKHALHKPARRSSATMGAMLDSMTSAGGNRNLFDEHEKREKKLGRIQLEIKPLAVEDETQGCAEAVGASFATVACAAKDANETYFICSEEPPAPGDQPPTEVPAAA